MTLKLNLEVTDDSSPAFQYIPISQTISLLSKDAPIKCGYLNNSLRSASLLEDFVMDKLINQIFSFNLIHRSSVFGN